MRRGGRVFPLWRVVLNWALGVILAVGAAGAAEARGYTLAFGSFAPAHTEIFVAAGDGGQPRRLAPTRSLNLNPALSPDGAWVVFTSYRAGPASLYRIRKDGSGLERLTRGSPYDDQAAISPDGRHVAFVSTRDGAANIWTLDLRTRGVRQLTRERSGNFRPAWSPDGQWIAFSSERAARTRQLGIQTAQMTDVFVMRRDGANVRRLTNTEGVAGSPRWSPDGTAIVFVQATLAEALQVIDPTKAGGRTRLMVIDVAGQSARPQVDGGLEYQAPQWLRDGRLAFSVAGRASGLAFSDGARGPPGEFASPSWSADGVSVVYHREDRGEWPPVQPWPSTDRRFKLVRTGLFPSFAPGGEEIVCNPHDRAEPVRNSILRMRFDGAGRRVLFAQENAHPLAPAWSPDGQWVVFNHAPYIAGFPGAPRKTRLALIRADGSQLTMITPNEDDSGFPSWSPDSQRIVFRRTGAKGRELVILGIADRSRTTLSSGPWNDNFPAWSPDGRHVAFASDRDGSWQIYVVAANGSGLRRLTEGPRHKGHPAWSPDGKWIALSAADIFRDEAIRHHVNPQGNGRLAVVRSDGSDFHFVTNDPYEEATAAFQPDTSKRLD